MPVEFDAKNIPRELYYGFIRHNVREFEKADETSQVPGIWTG